MTEFCLCHVMNKKPIRNVTDRKHSTKSNPAVETRLICLFPVGLDKTWRVEIPDVEKVAWVWCLFFCFMAPEAGTWVRSARMCIFKVRTQKIASL